MATLYQRSGGVATPATLRLNGGASVRVALHGDTPPPPPPPDGTYTAAMDYLGIGGGGMVDQIAQATDTSGNVTQVIRTDSAAFHHWDNAQAKWVQDETVSGMGREIALGEGGGAIGRAVTPGTPSKQWLLALDDLWHSTNGGTTWTAQGMSMIQAPNGTWRQCNPRIAIDPRNANHIIVGTPWDGMLRSTDGATFAPVTIPLDPLGGTRTWTAASYGDIDRGENGLTACPGVTVIFDPTSATQSGRTSRVYAIVNGVGVLVSTDTGATWTNLVAPYPLLARGLAVSPNNGDLMLTGPSPAWSITRQAATTAGTFTITVTNGAGSATTTPLDHHATGATIETALNALGKGTWSVTAYVNTTTWATTATVDFLIALSYSSPVDPAYNMTLNSTGVTGGPLTMREDSIAQAFDGEVKVIRYRPGTGWADVTPGNPPRAYSGVAYSPHTPGLVVTAGLQGNFYTNRMRVSLNYGDTWGVPTSITTDPVASDVEWMATTTPLSLNFVDAVWDNDDPLVVWGTDGIGLWKHQLSSVATNTPAVTMVSRTAGIEQMVATDMATLPGNSGEDTRVFCGSWDRPIFVSKVRGQYPANYEPTVDFGDAWTTATVAGDSSFLLATIANHQNGTGSDRSAYSTDKGETWTTFPVPDTTNWSWGFGQICPSTRTNWIITACAGKVPRYTLNAGATWTAITLPNGGDATKVDTTSSTNFSARRAVVALGSLHFILMVRTVGVYETTDGGATWVQLCPWSAVPVGASNFSFPARLSAVDRTTGLAPSSAGNADLWWVTGATTASGDYDRANVTVKSTDGGTTWTVVPGIGTVHAIAFTPPLPGGSGYLTCMAGFDTAGDWAVMVSDDAGDTWQKVGGRLADMYVAAKCATGDPYVPGRFYFGTASSFFQVDVTD